MILVNDKQVEFTKFPDGTTSFRYNPFGSMTRIFNITWKYDGDEECILLWYLVNHIRDHDRNVRLRLLLPYIPNARMDRVKNADEVFTLKWFAEFINTLDFDDVLVDDPHSNVSAALLDRVKVYDAQPHIQKALDKLDDKNVLLCYPDEGAAKRYSSQAGREYVFWLIVVIVLVLIWFCLSFAFKGVGGVGMRLYNDAKKEISEETEKKTDEEKEVKE